MRESASNCVDLIFDKLDIGKSNHTRDLKRHLMRDINMNETGNTEASKMRTYKTSDIYYASFLASLDIPLKTTETETMPDGGKKVVFVFQLPEADLQRLKASYFGGNGTVKARRFVDNIRSLKSMCFT